MEDIEIKNEILQNTVKELKLEVDKWLKDEEEEIDFRKIEILERKIFKKIVLELLKNDQNFGIFYTKLETMKRIKGQNVIEMLNRKYQAEEFDQKSLSEMISLIQNSTKNRIFEWSAVEKSLQIFSKIIKSKGAFFTNKKSELLKQKGIEKEAAVLKQKNSQLENQIEDLKLTLRQKEDENTKILGSLFNRDFTINNLSKINPSVSPFEGSPWLKTTRNKSPSKILNSEKKAKSLLTPHLNFMTITSDDGLKDLVQRIESKEKMIKALKDQIGKKDQEIEVKNLELDDKKRLILLKSEAERHKQFSCRLSTDEDFLSNLNEIRDMYNNEIDGLKKKIYKEKILSQRKIEAKENNFRKFRQEQEIKFEKLRNCYEDQMEKFKTLLAEYQKNDSSTHEFDREYTSHLEEEMTKLKNLNKGLHEKVGKLVFQLKKRNREKTILLKKMKRMEKNIMEFKAEFDLPCLKGEKFRKFLLNKDKEIMELKEKNNTLRTKNVKLLTDIKDKTKNLVKSEKEKNNYKLLLESNINSKNSKSDAKIKQLSRKIENLNSVVEEERNTVAKLRYYSSSKDKHLVDEIEILHKIFETNSKKKRMNSSFTGRRKSALIQKSRQRGSYLSNSKHHKKNLSVKSCIDRNHHRGDFSFFENSENKNLKKKSGIEYRGSYREGENLGSKRRMSLNEYSKIKLKPSASPFKNDYYYKKGNSQKNAKNPENYEFITARKKSVLSANRDFLNKQKFGVIKKNERKGKKIFEEFDVSFNLDQYKTFTCPNEDRISIKPRMSKHSKTFFETQDNFFNSRKKKSGRLMKKKFRSILNSSKYLGDKKSKVKNNYFGNFERETINLGEFLGKSATKSLRNPSKRKGRFSSAVKENFDVEFEYDGKNFRTVQQGIYH